MHRPTRRGQRESATTACQHACGYGCMHQPTRKARAPRLPAGRCTVRTVPQVSAAVSELAHRTVDLLVRHGVRGSGIAVTAIYTERARIRAINRHAASLPPHAWLMVPDVDEFFHFPCRVWVRALASQVSLASQVVWYASQVVTYASQVVCLTGGMPHRWYAPSSLTGEPLGGAVGAERQRHRRDLLLCDAARSAG